jgi:hypothetical protein
VYRVYKAYRAFKVSKAYKVYKVYRVFKVYRAFKDLDLFGKTTGIMLLIMTLMTLFSMMVVVGYLDIMI